jgi:xanthine/CO dehydrogenase XdhC/CoxF family maturation factor
MSTTRKKNIRIRRKKPSLTESNVVVVTHTHEKDTLVLKKLKKANDMLTKAKMMNS